MNYSSKHMVFFNYLVICILGVLKLFVFYNLQNHLIKLDFVFEKSEDGLVVHGADNGSPVYLLYWDVFAYTL